MKQSLWPAFGESLQLDNEARTWGLRFETQLSSIASHNSSRNVQPKTAPVGPPLQRLKQLIWSGHPRPCIAEVSRDPGLSHINRYLQLANRPVQDCTVTIVGEIQECLQQSMGIR